MKLIHYTQPAPTRFDSGPARGVDGRVLVGKADGAENFCMRIFEIAPNGHTPRHTHPWEHEIFVHSGQGEVLSADRWHPMDAGSALFIPGGTEHQIRTRGADPLVFICLIPSGAPEL